jgi:uncharacterized protein (TIGR03437 family)
MRNVAFRAFIGFLILALLFFTVDRLAGRKAEVSAQSAIQLIPVASGLANPLFVTSARDGSNRLFIIEQPGRIRILAPGASAPAQTSFLDITSKIVFGGEQGLLGLAFHPQYATNRRFFVDYTRKSDGATVISEFKASSGDPNVADPQERVILTIAQPYSNHNGGWIAFGPDGYLYIGMGDGGSGNDPENRAQNKDELLGKILRIDVNTDGSTPYVSPSTNPFFGSTPGRDEIYALGLRNPFRCSFDRGTGQLYAGDVGQGMVEEVDIVTLGGNYGWRVFEGSRCTNLGPAACTASNYVAPIAEYDHFTNGRCSITGGYVYRGTRNSLPVGSYVYGDYCSGEIFLLNGGASSLLLDTTLSISSFGEDEAGEIYVVGLGGTVHRIASTAAPASMTPVSAANYRGPQLAMESIAAAFGQNFAATTQASPGDRALPTNLAGASVSVVDSNGTSRLAPLFFVAPTQINFQIPPGTTAGNGTISVIIANQTVASGAVSIVNTAPGIFTANATGSGIASGILLRIKSNGTQLYEPIFRIDSQNQFAPIPIDLGPDQGVNTDRVFLAVFGSGFRFRSSLGAVAATLGGTPAQVLFAGAQPSFVGLDQANIQLPRSLIGRGDVDLVFTVDGQNANTVRVNFK